MVPLALLFLLLLATFGAPGAAPPSLSPSILLPAGWVSRGRAPPHANVRLVFALRQSSGGVRRLKEALLEISDPSNGARYGRWMTQRGVAEIVAPPESAFRAVEDWIRSAVLGAGSVVDAANANQTANANHTAAPTTTTRVGGDAVALSASVAQIEHLFLCKDMELHHVTRTQTHGADHRPAVKSVIKATRRSNLHPLLQDCIPQHVRAVVDMVSPIFTFIQPTRTRRRQNTLADLDPPSPGPAVVPSTLINLYGLPNPSNNAAAGTTLTNNAVAEMQHALGPEGFDVNDLNTYQKAMKLPASIVPAQVKGGHNDGIDQTGECTMDTDIVGALAQNHPTTFWLEDEWMFDLALALSASTTPPNVVSISWGFAETRQCGPTDYGPDMPANCTELGIISNISYVERTNTEFMKLGARGVTLVASSGDSGAPGDLNNDCSLDDGPSPLNPEFPASSPWVLSVGATMLGPNPDLLDPKAAATPSPCKPALFRKGFKCAKNGTEIVASLESGSKITSGGGFSTVSTRPTWQDDVVEAYLNQKSGALPPSASFNASNRAYPDVSAAGHNHLVYLKGTGTRGWDLFDGTSASAPIWAAIITHLNDARVAAGKSVLGYIPPSIYQFAKEVPGGFQDIAGGDNKCTVAADDNVATDGCCTYGYESQAGGWDPVTGFGTPKFDKLLEWVNRLPSGVGLVNGGGDGGGAVAGGGRGER